MATIDLIVLGILKKESLSAYDIQKLVEYRNISKWVKISTPSIYKSNSAGRKRIYYQYNNQRGENARKGSLYINRFWTPPI